MKKNALRKDFYMEIKKSLGRFLSIFFIVALGVSFFSGIRSSEPDMRLSGDVYFDENHLMDIKVVSTLGLTKQDVKRIQKLPEIEKAEGSFSTDVLCTVGENKKVLHVMAKTKNMNDVTVEEGRFPEKPTECFADIDFLENSGYKVGDVIELESGTDEELKERFRHTSLKIVGSGSSPCYVSFGRGSSTIGTGEVSGFLVVPKENFDMEAYTEVYVKVKGAKDEIAFSEEYEEKIDGAMDLIEAIADVSCQIRKDGLAEEAQLKIDDARNELTQKRIDAEKQFLENEKKLSDGAAELAEGKIKIIDGKYQLASGKAEMDSKGKELQNGIDQYISGKNQLEQARQQLEEKSADYYKNYDSNLAKIEDGEKTLNAEAEKLEEQKQQLLQAKALIDGARGLLDKQKAEIDRRQAEYDAFLTSPDYTPVKAAQMKLELDMLKGVYEGALEVFEPRENEFYAQYNEAWPQIQAGEKLIEEKKKELQEARTQLEQGPAEIQKARELLDSKEKELNDAKALIDSGQTQMKEGEALLTEKEKELQKAEQKILSGEKEIEDGKQALEEAKKEAELKFAEGEAEITEAEKEIEKIELPTWYIFDRSVLTEYQEYGDNADRMKAIGKVFPVLFFLVAALISLTTMTRMVEEQRTQIGTLKALGYSKGAIMRKYMNYALIATLGGSVAGVLIGEKIFPYIIVYAYKIMYTHIPHIIIPYQWGYGVSATLIAVFCTMAATLSSCYRELIAQPAVLMRPEAPKQGRRILMERFTFLWKHLSFTWKSTLRNLIRYKKRFFMTIFGIGGCMALLLVGFGLKDSIMSIAELQYDNLQTYNSSIYMNDEMTADVRKDLKTYLENEKLISDYMSVHMKNAMLKGKSNEKEVYLVAVDDLEKRDEFLVFQNRVSRKSYDLTDDGVILTEKIAKMLDVKAGDSISVINGEKQKKKVKVSAVCENYIGHYVYMTTSLYEKLYGEKPVLNNILLKSDASDAELQKIGEKILKYDDVLNVQYMDSLKGRLDDMLKSLNIVIVVLIISAGMLAFVVLYNLNNININERKRELATIKVLGFYDLEVAEYVYRENILLTLIGALVGCGLGNLLHRFIITTVEVEMIMFGRLIFMRSYIYGILFTIAFSVFVNWIMYFKLKKINMVESLKSVE